ncbi:hypothetical protein F0344_18655 [Streptomyces finlayi]|uniref:WD40 repeat domain-containing protein n=1 Tax=Streptomyces finlayi TaxID=67296 RepID=A0A7G7BM12_9ACTN|nr:hypothetical protein [Streptomyces finlayi]QNE76377.1 hypothetical protein F0344_18655 [Streptomyces finlayi]
MAWLPTASPRRALALNRVAVTPGGDRLVLCDGHRLIATDAALTRALAAAAVPQEHADVSGPIFADDDLLVTAGNHGGLTLWRLDELGLEPVARRDTVRLSELFAVPEWGVVGGKAGSEARIHFFDPANGLAPVAGPAAVVGDGGRLKAVMTAPNGRYVVYSGRLDAGEPIGRRSFAWLTRIHDLHHPGAILQNPLGALAAPQLDALSHATAASFQQRDLFRLACTLGCRP